MSWDTKYIGVYKGRMSGEIRKSMIVKKAYALDYLRLLALGQSSADLALVEPNMMGNLEVFDLIGFEVTADDEAETK